MTQEVLAPMYDEHSVGSGDADIAWAAGLFEGEGCLSGRHQGKRGSGAQLRLGMTDRDVVVRFAEVVGCGSIYIHKPGTGSHKPLHTWYLYEASKVVEVIERLLPWFGARRTAKALEILAIARNIVQMSKRTHCPNGHAYDGTNLVLEPIMRNGQRYFARRCKICRTEQSRARARKRLGVTPDRYRVAE